jgi:glutathione S-transferase
MLELYHTGGSSNSQRVRIVLAEKGLQWESRLLAAGQQHGSAFRAISPSGTVPTLVHDGHALKDSLVINEYLEDYFPVPALRPSDAYATALMRQWTKHADDYLQQSIAVFTHALWRRSAVLEQFDGNVDAALAQIDDPIILRWRHGVYTEGVESPFVAEALRLILASLARIDVAVKATDWLVGTTLSLADIALLPAIYRLECLAMDFLWTSDFPAMRDWLQRGKERASFQTAVSAYVSEETVTSYRASGLASRRFLENLAVSGQV